MSAGFPLSPGGLPERLPERLPEQERRSSNIDRRNQHRSGKYDRRKNRCGGCQYFTPARDGQPAQCQQGQVTTLDAETFACLAYVPITAE